MTLISQETNTPIRYILPIRDMIQSLYGGKIPHDAPELLGVYKALKNFNDNGPVQIAGIEGHGGALPQYDVLQGRYPLVTARNITNALDPSLIQRPLIRGPFGVGLNALHLEDLQWTYQQMAEAGGARQGHTLIFKLFEAQNRPVEHLESLKAITALKKAGYNVACEVAMVVSDKPDLNIQHYEKVAQSLMDPDYMKRHGVDSSIVVGFSLKDMIGGIKASQHAENKNGVDAKNLTSVALKTAQQFAERTGQSLYIGWHSHDIGNAVDCLEEAGKTYAGLRRQFPGVTEFQQDAIAGSQDLKVIPNFGFADLEKVVARHQANGIAPGFSEKQKEIWNDVKSRFVDLARTHAASLIDTREWPKEFLEAGQLASGGLPYVEKNAIQAYSKHVATTVKGPDGRPVGYINAGRILRNLFSSINGTLAHDLGNAHSVTPAMKALNDLTIDVMSSILSTNFIQRRLDQGHSWGRLIQDPSSQAEIRSHYKSFRNPQAMSYFCTEMPTEVKPEVLGLLRTKLFDLHFPKTLDGLSKVSSNNSASMLKKLDLTESAYEGLRMALAAQLVDKENAARLLKRSGVDPSTADTFVTSHIGVNENPVNAGVKPMILRRVAPAVDAALEASGGNLIIRQGIPRGVDARTTAMFSASLMRPRQGEDLAEPVATLLGKTLFRRHHGWKEFMSASAEGLGPTFPPRIAAPLPRLG